MWHLGPLRFALPDPSIDRRSYKQLDVGKALFLTLNLKKAIEQGMIGDNKDFSGKDCVKWTLSLNDRHEVKV